MKLRNEHRNTFLLGAEIALNTNSIVNQTEQTVSITSKIDMLSESSLLLIRFSGSVLIRNEIVVNSTKNDESLAIS